MATWTLKITDDPKTPGLFTIKADEVPETARKRTSAQEAGRKILEALQALGINGP